MQQLHGDLRTEATARSRNKTRNRSSGHRCAHGQSLGFACSARNREQEATAGLGSAQRDTDRRAVCVGLGKGPGLLRRPLPARAQWWRQGAGIPAERHPPLLGAQGGPGNRRMRAGSGLTSAPAGRSPRAQSSSLGDCTRRPPAGHLVTPGLAREHSHSPDPRRLGGSRLAL